MVEYEKFSEETKKFFQKAMDIYENIESLKIEKEVEKLGSTKHQCTLSRLDVNDTIRMYKKGKIKMYKIVHGISP